MCTCTLTIAGITVRPVKIDPRGAGRDGERALRADGADAPALNQDRSPLHGRAGVAHDQPGAFEQRWQRRPGSGPPARPPDPAIPVRKSATGAWVTSLARQRPGVPDDTREPGYTMSRKQAKRLHPKTSRDKQGRLDRLVRGPGVRAPRGLERRRVGTGTHEVQGGVRCPAARRRSTRLKGVWHGKASEGVLRMCRGRAGPSGRRARAEFVHRGSQGHEWRGIAGRDGGSIQSGPDRRQQDGHHGFERAVPPGRPAARHLHGGLHAPRLQDDEAGEGRTEDRLHRHAQRHPRSGRPRRSDHRHRRLADRGRLDQREGRGDDGRNSRAGARPAGRFRRWRSW